MQCLICANLFATIDEQKRAFSRPHSNVEFIYKR